ncbi:tetraspanin-33-like [Mytilus edulis]|uniref:tetraspanin-33-like n=1 Tax=Mytilus edulis TaxID=6550 RepID=UPI0039EFB831
MADHTTRSQGKHRYKTIKSKRQPLCARTSYSCHKLCLFLYTLCYLVIGLALLGIGIYVEVERREYTGLEKSLSLPVAILIFIGLFISINGLCGLVGTVEENISLLKLFLVLSVATFLAQIATAILIYVNGIEISDLISSKLALVLNDFNRNPDLRSTMDSVQNKYSCCGISSWHDYVEYAEACRERCPYGNPCNNQCIFPKSCCSMPNVPQSAINCTSNKVSEVPPSMTIKNGCFYAFVDWLSDRMDLIGATTLGLALPQVAGIIWAYLVLRKIREYQCWYTVELASDYENKL